MNSKTGKLSAGILFVTLTAASALAQIPAAVQHVPDKTDTSATAKAPAGKPAAATAAKPGAATAAKPAVTVVAHSPAVAHSPSAAKSTTTAAQKTPATAVATKPVSSKPVTASDATSTKVSAAPKKDPFAKAIAPKTNAKSAPQAIVVKSLGNKGAETKTTETKTADAKTAESKTGETQPTESKDETAEKKKEAGFITAGSRRDPFVSPIVQHLSGPGCSTGKRCLAIDQIALRGIVKSDAGMIAVVVNSLDKAYFLRENDPVFNGYVLKISGDSVVFKETVQDKLGHLSTREVVKKITTPAV